MNKFADRFKSHTNSELINIIESSLDYQPLAVEAAKNEISSRGLTELDLNKAKQEQRAGQSKIEKKAERNHEFIEEVENIADSIKDAFNPIPNSPITIDKLIIIISVIFGGLAIFHIAKDFGFLRFMLSENGEWDFSMLLYFLPFFLVPAATALFWGKKRIGWILLCIYSTYTTINSIGTIILTWNISASGNSSLDTLFPSVSPASGIMVSLFFGGILWVLNKHEMLQKFKIDKKVSIRIIGLTAIATVLIILQNW